MIKTVEICHSLAKTKKFSLEDIQLIDEPPTVSSKVNGKSSDKFVPVEKSGENVPRDSFKAQWVWRNIFVISFLHVLAFCGLYEYFFRASFTTMLYNHFVMMLFGFGITCGAHRLWCHRTYEASLPLQIFLMILNCSSLQNDIYEWSRDHRVHHKFSETDADPHNSKRGFFFAHMGWLMTKKHPDVFTKGKTVSMADLENDPVVQFQRKYYILLVAFFTFYLPGAIPYYLWNENFVTSFLITFARYTISLHFTWCVNSVAHLYGYRQYDTNIGPVESKFVQISAIGEGYHNFHHVFPYDYSASELSWDQNNNPSTLFIDFMVWLGLARNCKRASPKAIKDRIERTGDRTLATAYYSEHKSNKLKSLFPSFVLVFLLPITFYAIRICIF